MPSVKELRTWVLPFSCRATACQHFVFCLGAQLRRVVVWLRASAGYQNLGGSNDRPALCPEQKPPSERCCALLCVFVLLLLLVHVLYFLLICAGAYVRLELI